MSNAVDPTRGEPRTFDPLHLTPDASLNRTSLGALPGADATLVGRYAFDVLRLQALADLATAHGFASDAPPAQIPRRLAGAVASPAAAEARAARAVLRAYARRLGHLIASLHLADDPHYVAAPQASDTAPSPVGAARSGHRVRAAYRAYWRGVANVWLAGGVIAALGEYVLADVRAEVARLGATGITLRLAPHADVRALIGAANAAGAARRRGYAMVFDFGYTDAKRGLARIGGGGLEHVLVLPSVPRGAVGRDDVPTHIVQIVTRTLEAARQALPDLDIGLHARLYASVASYLTPQGFAGDAGQLYGCLDPNTVSAIEAALAARAGAPFRLRLLHDGTAAANGLAPAHGAVIVVGSSLGVGFTAAATDPRPSPPPAAIEIDRWISREP